jgi:isochorismate synthase
VATGTLDSEPSGVRELAARIRELAPRFEDHVGPVVVSIELSLLDPLLLWAGFPGEEATYWRSPSGELSASIGRVLSIPAGPGSEPAESDARLQRLAGSILHLDGRTAAPRPEPVRLYGGAAFDAGNEPDVWQGFGSGEFVLPRLAVERRSDLTSLRVAADRAEGDSGASVAAGLARLVERLEETIDAPPLRSADEDGAPSPAGAEAGAAPPDWVELVDRAREAIRSGALRKVVICRRRGIVLDEPRDPAEVLSRLSSRSREYVFGVRRGANTFLGASPELLMQKSSRRLKTEALAGTRRLRSDREREEALALAAEELYASGKDLEEHALVVRGIVETLDPLVEQRALSPWPEVRGLTELAHLCSPILAELRPGVGPFQLLAALHPTPAVGGLPAADALRFLYSSEPVERGWYAGPIGWISTDGDTEIAVGIRSALLTPEVAWLFAGAGIVLASEPEAEYRETGAKLSRLSSALGVAEIPT